MSKKIYLAGKITGDPNYKEKFDSAAKTLRDAGYMVWNPAEMSQGFKYETYMEVGYRFLCECDAICLLSDFCDSKGALQELKDALNMGNDVMLFDIWLKEQKSESEEPWMPGSGDEYWFVDWDFEPMEITFSDGIDRGRIEAGNYFKTYEECEAAAERIKKAIREAKEA